MHWGSLEDREQCNGASVDYYFTHILEVHSYSVVDARLHLAKPPIRLGRVPHEHARLKDGVQILHVVSELV